MNALKQYYFCFFIIINTLTLSSHQDAPTVAFTFDFSQTKSWQSNTLHGIHNTNTIPSYNQPDYCTNQNKTYYASLSPQDFQHAFQHTSNANEILNQYQLYAFENFLTFARTLPEYEAYILALHKKIQSNKTFKKQTACMPYFSYSFSLRHETSGFHDFIAAEAQRIINIKKQTSIASTRQTTCYARYQDLDALADQCCQKLQTIAHKNHFNNRLTERIDAINKTRNNNGLCFDYSSLVTHTHADDPDINIFQNRYGTYLDCQLHKELCQIRNEMRQLEYTYPNNAHINILAPTIYHYTAQAKIEQSLSIAFELSDFCHTITHVLANGMQILHDASSAIGRGAQNAASNFVSVEHWQDIATGALQCGLLFADAIGQEDALHYALVLNTTTDDSEALLSTARKYSAYTQGQKNTVMQCLQKTYKTIKTMSWQEVLERGAEIGTTIILDTLAFHAVSGFAHATSTIFRKQLHQALESGSLFTKQHTLEVAGFGKLLIEEGTEISTTVTQFIKNDLASFVQNSKNISHSADIESIAGKIHKNFEHLIKAANTLIKGNNTAAGRAFQKHTIRERSAFVGEITGNAIKNMQQAIAYINKIIKSSESKFTIKNTKSYGNVLDIRLPDGMGARWTSDGKTFIGFLERYTTK